MPVGLVAGIDRLAQANNAFITATWPANPATDNVDHYEIMWRDVTAATGASRESTTDLTLTIHGLVPGHQYGFKIQAVNTTGNQSGFSVEKFLTLNAASGGLDTIAPAVPTGLTAYKTPRGALVSWNANTEPDLQGYTPEYLPALTTAIVGGTPITSIACQPLIAPLANGASITVTDGVNSFSAVLSALAAQGATTLAVTSVTPVASYTTAAAYLIANQIISTNSLTSSLVFVAPTGTPLGALLRFRVSANDWTGNLSAPSAVLAAVASDGILFDELLVGNLKVFGTITTGGLQTAASGARVVVDSSGIRLYDGSATNYGAPSGAGVTVELRPATGSGFFSGQLAASLIQTGGIQSSTGSAIPAIPGGFNGYQLDPTNGLRFFSGGTVIASWTPTGNLTIFSGATVYAGVLATSAAIASGLNAASGLGGFRLTGSQLDFNATSNSAPGGVSWWSTNNPTAVLTHIGSINASYTHGTGVGNGSAYFGITSYAGIQLNPGSATFGADLDGSVYVNCPPGGPGDTYPGIKLDGRMVIGASIAIADPAAFIITGEFQTAISQVAIAKSIRMGINASGDAQITMDFGTGVAYNMDTDSGVRWRVYKSGVVLFTVDANGTPKRTGTNSLISSGSNQPATVAPRINVYGQGGLASTVNDLTVESNTTGAIAGVPSSPGSTGTVGQELPSSTVLRTRYGINMSTNWGWDFIY